LTVFFVLVLIGCGSTESNTNTMAVNTGPNLNSQNASLPNSANANFNSANSFNANANRPMDAQIQRLEEIRKAANRSGKPIPNLNSRPAPEDSTITATLTDFARETRTWKKHPVLLKVEKVHDGGNGSIKVYLRSGKVIDLPGKAIGRLDQIQASAILQLAGVESSSAADARARSKKQP
jgi:hypothetical protein